MCSLLGVKKTWTSPYHPRSDGMIERFNRTIEVMLRVWVDQSQTDWDEHLALLAMAYRSSEHETTKETPNAMMLGREVRMPVDLLVDPIPVSVPTATTAYAQNLQDKLVTAHEIARENTSTMIRAQKRHYAKNVERRLYDKGSVLWLQYQIRKKGNVPN